MGGSISISSTVSSCHSRNSSCIRSSSSSSFIRSSSSSSTDCGGNGLRSPAAVLQAAHAAAETIGRSRGGRETAALKTAGACCCFEIVGRENCDTTDDGGNNFGCHFLNSSRRDCNGSGSRDERSSSKSCCCNATSVGSGGSSIASVGSSIYSSSSNSSTSSRGIIIISSSSSSSSSRSSSSSSLVDKVAHRLLASDTEATAQRILDLARRQRSGSSASGSTSSPAGNKCRYFSRNCSASSLSSSSAALSYVPQPPTAARLEECYVLGKQLGRGHVGMVRLCEEIATGNTFACKTVLRSSVKKREGGSGSDVDGLFSEVLAMLGLRSAAVAEATSNAAAATPASRRRKAAASGSPAVAAAGDLLVQLHEVFVDDVAVHLILDHCAGGDLLDHVMGRQGLREREAARILQQIAAAVAKMHALGFVHRDLKPENMLVVQPAPVSGNNDIAIKIADFGLCVKLNPGQSVKGFVGSPHYMAPEVVSEQEYGQEVDVWGMGVTLFASLSGRFPFGGNSHDEIYAAILKAQLDFAKEPWLGISHQAKDLIRRMLQPDPSRRISAMDVLRHPWVLQHCDRPSTAPLAATTPAADSASAATLRGIHLETATPVASPVAVPTAAELLEHEAASGQAGAQCHWRQPRLISHRPSHTSTSLISQKQPRVSHARLPHDRHENGQATCSKDKQSDRIVDARQCTDDWDTSDQWRRYLVGTPFVEPLHISSLHCSHMSSQPSPTSALDPIPSLESP